MGWPYFRAVRVLGGVSLQHIGKIHAIKALTSYRNAAKEIIISKVIVSLYTCICYMMSTCLSNPLGGETYKHHIKYHTGNIIHVIQVMPACILCVLL